MRHRVYGKHLGRDKDERSNLFKGLVRSLLTYGTIQTSQAKAKSIKGLVDKVVNLAKVKNNQIRLQSYVNDKLLQERLIKEIAPKMGNRISGYTSVIRMGPRSGDSTMMVKMSLIGMEELKPVERKVKEKSVRVENKKAEDVNLVKKTTKPIKKVSSNKSQTK